MVKDKVDDIVGTFKGREIWKEVALIWEVKKISNVLSFEILLILGPNLKKYIILQ